MIPPVNVNIQVKGFEKLFEIFKSYFGIALMRTSAQQKADALLIEAEAKREVRLLDAQTKVDVESIKERGEIEKKRIQAEGKHDLMMLRKHLKATEQPPPDDEIIVDIDDPEPAEFVNPYEYVEQRRFSNTKNVLKETIKALPEHAEIHEEPVDPDWYARFFENVKDVSNEDMQRLWGRLLAGEIAKPGSISKRTLSVLWDLDRAEAEIFVRACRLLTDDGRILILDDRNNYRSFAKHIHFASLERLEEYGLLKRSMLYKGGASGISLKLSFGHKSFVVKEGPSRSSLVGTIFTLTVPGCELAALNTRQVDESYLETLCLVAQRQGMTAARLVEEQEDAAATPPPTET